MPRQLRQFELQGIYHIIKRGVEKRDIFLRAQDYSRFTFGLEFCNNREPTNLWPILSKSENLDISKRLAEERGKLQKPITEILAVALMPNHFHLVLREITDGGISRFIQKLGGYSTYFNKQYNRVGSLFQGRFRVVPIKTDEQLYSIFVYVHTNPVELFEPGWKDFVVRDPNIAIKKLESYRWSSYLDYIKKEGFLGCVKTKFFLDFFGGKEKCREAIHDWIYYKARVSKLDRNLLE